MTTSETSYQWHPLAGKPNIVTRPMTNGEFFFQAMGDDAGETMGVFISAFLELDRQIDLASLKIRLRDAWIQTRDAAPIVGIKIARPKDDQRTMLEFDCNFTPEEVLFWADETISIIELDDTHITVSSLGQAHDNPVIPDRYGNNALLHCYVLRGLKEVKSIALGLWVSHELFDGPSSRVVLSELRHALAEPRSDMKWGTEEFNKARLKRLGVMSTLEIDDAKWPAKPLKASEAFGQKMASFANNLVHVLKATSNDRNSRQVISSLEKLSKRETEDLQNYCRKHCITATPLILAALVIRTVIEKHQEWPLTPESNFGLFFPIDPRSTFKNNRATGVHSVYSICIIPLGQIFKGKTQKELQGDIPRLIRLAAGYANTDFAEVRPVEARADIVLHNEANIAPFISALQAKQADFSATYLVLYSDGVLDIPTLDIIVKGRANGIGSELNDYIMFASTRIHTIITRSWVLDGQTSLLVSAPGSFMSPEYAQSTCIKWKEDILLAIKE